MVSSFAFAGYHPELLEGFLPAWLAVGVFVLPLALTLLIDLRDAPGKLAPTLHGLAAGLFLLLSAGMEVGVHLGHRPEGTSLYRLLAHLGWTFYLAVG